MISGRRGIAIPPPPGSPTGKLRLVPDEGGSSSSNRTIAIRLSVPGVCLCATAYAPIQCPGDHISSYGSIGRACLVITTGNTLFASEASDTLWGQWPRSKEIRLKATVRINPSWCYADSGLDFPGLPVHSALAALHASFLADLCNPEAKTGLPSA